METQTLQAEVRETSGKGPARQLRMRGLIPAVIYGPGGDTEMLSLSPKDLMKAVSNAYGRNTVLEVVAGGRTQLAMLREVAVHPVSREPIHIDFLRVSPDREVEVEVPFQARGRAAGVQKGGKLKVVRRSVPVRCTPGLIPAVIEVEVTPLEMGDTLAVKDVPLAEGLMIPLRAELTLVIIEGEERAAPEEGAPGAGPADKKAADKKSEKK